MAIVRKVFSTAVVIVVVVVVVACGTICGWEMAITTTTARTTTAMATSSTQVLPAPHPVTVVVAVVVAIVRTRSHPVGAWLDDILLWHWRRVANNESYYPHHALVYRIAAKPRDLKLVELD